MLSVYEEELVCWSIQIFWEFFCKLFSLNSQYSDEVILNLRVLLSHGISELVTEVENFLVFSQAVIALIVKPCFGFVGWHWDQWRTGGHPHEAGGVGRSVLCGGTAWGGTWGRPPPGSCITGVILKYFLCKSIMCLEAQVTHFSLDNNLIKKIEFF